MHPQTPKLPATHQKGWWPCRGRPRTPTTCPPRPLRQDAFRRDIIDTEDDDPFGPPRATATFV